jgi:hypothetical protein
MLCRARGRYFKDWEITLIAMKHTCVVITSQKYSRGVKVSI